MKARQGPLEDHGRRTKPGRARWRTRTQRKGREMKAGRPSWKRRRRKRARQGHFERRGHSVRRRHGGPAGPKERTTARGDGEGGSGLGPAGPIS